MLKASTVSNLSVHSIVIIVEWISHQNGNSLPLLKKSWVHKLGLNLLIFKLNKGSVKKKWELGCSFVNLLIVFVVLFKQQNTMQKPHFSMWQGSKNTFDWPPYHISYIYRLYGLLYTDSVPAAKGSSDLMVDMMGVLVAAWAGVGRKTITEV